MEQADGNHTGSEAATEETTGENKVKRKKTKDRGKPQREAVRRCATCGVHITPSKLPFCSHKHFRYAVFGEPEVHKKQRHEAGDFWPVETDESIRESLAEIKTRYQRGYQTRLTEAPDFYPPGSIYETDTYRLTDWEISYIQQFAKRINRMHRETGANRNVTGGDDFKLNVLGFAGEFAFSRLFNVFPDLFTLEVRRQEQKFGGVDAVLPSGFRVDVKTTGRDPNKPGFGLTIEGKKSDSAVDLYVLMAAHDWPNIRYIGYVPVDYAHAEAFKKTFKGGASGHFIPAEETYGGVPR